MRPLKERLLQGVYRITRYHAWWVVLFFALVAGFGAYYAMDVPLRSSFMDLLPTDDPLVNQFRETQRYTTANDYIAIHLKLTEDVPFEEREARLLGFAERVAESLEGDPEILLVTYLQDLTPAIPEQYLYLFDLSEEELGKIEQSINLARSAIGSQSDISLPSGITLSDAYAGVADEFIRALYSEDLSMAAGSDSGPAMMAQLDTVSSLNRVVLSAIDGLTELPQITSAVNALSTVFAPNLEVDSEGPSGFFSDDRTALLMTVQPRLPSSEGTEYSSLVSDRVREAIAAADPEASGLRAGLAGTYPYNQETNDVINYDMLRTTIISSIGVFVIFMLAFGSFFYSIIAVVPLLISVVLTMCWARFALGGFNLVTTFLPALVLGLGIDYAIHLVSRYAEERSAGQSLNRALYAAIRHKGEASFLAALTTALVFLGMLTAKSRALFEMGVISSIGVLAAFIVTLFLLPAMITLAHHLFHIRHRETVATHAAKLTSAFRLVTSRGRAIFVIILVLTFFVAFQASQISFVFSSSDLVPRVEMDDVYDEIVADFGFSPAGIGYAYTFKAANEAELQKVVSRLEENELVMTVESAAELLPVNLTEQQRVLNELNIDAYIDQLETLRRSLVERGAAVAQIRTLLTQFALLQFGASLNAMVDVAVTSNEIIGQLRTLQTELGALDAEAAIVQVADLQAALGGLDTSLSDLRELPPVEELLRDVLSALPREIRSQYLDAEGRFVIKATVSPAIFDGANLDEFDAMAESLSVEYFGTPLVVRKLRGMMVRDFYISTLLALALIAIVMRKSLGGWVRALVAGSPLVLGYVWMLAGMRLLDINFNFLSITISPLLIGIGVDNGIHILHRTMEERMLRPEGAIERSLGSTAVAVIVTSLTTMLVFGSLLAARTPGLRMLGTSALLGIGFSLLFSLLFLPAALRVEGGKRV